MTHPFTHFELASSFVFLIAVFCLLENRYRKKGPLSHRLTALLIIHKLVVLGYNCKCGECYIIAKRAALERECITFQEYFAVTRRYLPGKNLWILRFWIIRASWLATFKAEQTSEFLNSSNLFFSQSGYAFTVFLDQFLACLPTQHPKKKLYSVTIGMYEKRHTIRVSLSRSFCFSQQTISLQHSGTSQLPSYASVRNFQQAVCGLDRSTRPRGFSLWLEAWPTAIEKERFRGLFRSLLVGLLKREYSRIVFIISCGLLI